VVELAPRSPVIRIEGGVEWWRGFGRGTGEEERRRVCSKNWRC
jgi:hypothetical protein